MNFFFKYSANFKPRDSYFMNLYLCTEKLGEFSLGEKENGEMDGIISYVGS